MIFGFVLKALLQHGQRLPAHCTKTSHAVHHFCPVPYLVCGIGGFAALYLGHIPLHGIMITTITTHEKSAYEGKAG